jgi:L-lactate dehydrogenase complex protein LldG
VTPAERQAMREGLARALRTGDLPGGGPEHPGRFAPPPPPASIDLEARFTSELTTLGGQVHQAASIADVVRIVTELAEREGGRRILAWDDREFPVEGLGAALERAGCHVQRQQPGDSRDPNRRDGWANATVGVTSATACLAETGSVVVISGPGRGRLASLLTPIHVVVVTRSLLQWSFPALLASHPELATSGTNMVCITGPSRTADIEHTLSRGVHGPREVHVVFVG